MMSDASGQHRGREHRELFPRVSAILFQEWDPIGIADLGRAEWPTDEYDSYVPAVIGLLLGGADRPTIADHLARLWPDITGEPADRARCDRTAALLIGLVDGETR